MLDFEIKLKKNSHKHGSTMFLLKLRSQQCFALKLTLQYVCQ